MKQYLSRIKSLHCKTKNIIMKENTLHVICGRFSAHAMKFYIDKYGINDDILALNNEFRYAPLFSNMSEETIVKRSQSIDNLFGIKYYDIDPYTEIKAFVNHDFDKYDRVVVWHGNNVDEQILLYFTASLVKRNLYEVDITYIIQYLPNKKVTSIILYCCSTENIKLLYDRINPISKGMQCKYVSMWEKWSKSEAQLRIMDKNNLIIEVKEDYFDELIISNCSYEYEKVARIVGKVLYKCSFFVGDNYLTHRIAYLIKKEVLSACLNNEFKTEIEKCNQDTINRIGYNELNSSNMRFYLIKIGL